MVTLDQLLVNGWTTAENPDADGQFDNAPIFNFNDGQLKFNTNWVSNANDHYGSASGFIPKPLSRLSTATSKYEVAVYVAVDFIQPPNIRPISTTSVTKIVYCLQFMQRVS